MMIYGQNEWEMEKQKLFELSFMPNGTEKDTNDRLWTICAIFHTKILVRKIAQMTCLWSQKSWVMGRYGWDQSKQVAFLMLSLKLWKNTFRPLGRLC